MEEAINVNSRIKLKEEFIFLYDGDYVFIYNYIEEKVLIRVQLDSKMIVVIKKLDGIKKLREAMQGLDQQECAKMLRFLTRLKDKYFMECGKEQENAAFSSYGVRSFVNHNLGSFKVIPFEMINLLHKAILETRIVLVGCGVLGNELLYSLLEMGIRQFTLIDNQEVGSMDKRWAYFCKKSDQAAVRNQWVAKVAKEEYSDASFTLYENLEEYLACQKDEQECKSYCIVCKDEIEKEELLLYNDLFIKYDMKWTSVYIDSEKVSIGPTIIPRVTGCLECTTHSYEWPIYNGFNMVQLDSFHLAASLLAEDIYCHLGNIHEYIIKDISFTLGKQFVINLSGFNGHSNELIIDPRCNCRDKK